MHGRVRIPPRMIYMTLRGSTQFVGLGIWRQEILTLVDFLALRLVVHVLRTSAYGQPCRGERKDETRSISH